MGLESLQSLQNFNLLAAHSSSYSLKLVCARSSSLSSFQSQCNLSFSYSFGRPCILFVSCGDLPSSGLKQSCRAHFKGSFDDEFEDFARKFCVSDGKISKNSTCNGGDKSRERTDYSISFLPTFLEPNFLGIQRELSERDEIEKMSIVRKANSVEIPLSLRIIGRKQKCEGGSVDSENFAHCSAKKAFSSMVFMIRELQNYAVSTRGELCREDLHGVLNKLHKEMNASYVWLFKQVFSRTPNLMVDVMRLSANFTVNSLVDNMAANRSRRLHHNLVSTQEMSRKQVSVERSLTSLPEISFPGYEEMIKDEEEMKLWKSMVEEASMLQEKSTYPVLDQETKKQLVSAISVELEAEDYLEFHTTDIVYQMSVSEDPNNSLLSNYAQFLYLVRHDYDR